MTANIVEKKDFGDDCYGFNYVFLRSCMETGGTPLKSPWLNFHYFVKAHKIWIVSLIGHCIVTRNVGKWHTICSS